MKMTFMTLYCYFWLIISVLKKPNIQSEDNNNNLMTQKISLNLLNVNHFTLYSMRKYPGQLLLK